MLIIMSLLLLAGCAGVPPAETGLEPGGQPGTAVPDKEAGLSPGGIIFDATLAAQNADYRKAEEMLEQLIEREPENLEALKLLAKVYSTDGLKHLSSTTWKKVSVLDPADADAAYETGITLARNEKWSDLRTRMMKTESYGTADKRHYLLIGQADLELGYKTEAEKYLLKAASLELAKTLLGKLYYNQGKISKAETAFEETLKKNPVNYIANLHLGYISFNRGRLEKALDYYRRAHRTDPENALACLSLASLHQKMNHPVKAIEYYNKSISLKKIPQAEKKKAYISLCHLLLKENMINDIYSAVEKGLADFPSSGGLYFYWGEALLRQGKQSDAKEKYKQAARDAAWKKHALARFHSIR